MVTTACVTHYSMWSLQHVVHAVSPHSLYWQQLTCLLAGSFCRPSLLFFCPMFLAHCMRCCMVHRRNVYTCTYYILYFVELIIAILVQLSHDHTGQSCWFQLQSCSLSSTSTSMGHMMSAMLVPLSTCHDHFLHKSSHMTN